MATSSPTEDSEAGRGIIDDLEISNDSYVFEGNNYVPGGVDSSDDSATIISVLPHTSLSAEFMASLSTALSMALSLSFLNAKAFPQSSFSLLVLLATCAGVYYEKSHSPQSAQMQENLDLEGSEHPDQQGQGVLMRTLGKLRGSLEVFWKWCGAIIFHSIILLLHVVLSTHSLNECGAVRTLIVNECGPAATAIVVYFAKRLLSSKVFSISTTSGSSSGSAFDGEDIRASSPSNTRRSGTASNSRKLKVFAVTALSLVVLGFVTLIFSDTRSVSGNIALVMFNVINYTRVFFLPNIPPQAYLFPTLISGFILAPWGVPSLLTRKFILLFDIKLLIVLFASFFSVNIKFIAPSYHISHFIPFKQRFADYRATYMFKRQKNRKGIVYCAITHAVIISGFVFERILAKSHFATLFTLISSSLIIAGISIALDYLPASATHPRASDEDKNDVIEFIKSRADLLLSYYSHIKKKNYRKTIESTVGIIKKFVNQTVESPKTRRLLTYVILTFAFMGIEITYGITKDNLSLVSAGTYMFFDSFGLVVGLIASYVAKQPPNRMYSFGYGRVKLLSFFLNGFMLIAVSVLTLLDSIYHVFSGAKEAHSPMFVLISVIGLLIHLVGVVFFREYSHDLKKVLFCGNANSAGDDDGGNEDINLGGIFIHVMVDTMSSLSLLVSTICVQVYDYDICDPICSIAISVMTFRTVLPQMKKTLGILLQKSTFSEDTISAFQSRITELAEAESPGAVCTSIYVWTQTPGFVVATVKLDVPQDTNEQHILSSATRFLKDRGITSSCIECAKKTLKSSPNSPCLPTSSTSAETSK